jgi:hypothetical protein
MFFSLSFRLYMQQYINVMLSVNLCFLVYPDINHLVDLVALDNGLTHHLISPVLAFFIGIFRHDFMSEDVPFTATLLVKLVMVNYASLFTILMLICSDISVTVSRYINTTSRDVVIKYRSTYTIPRRTCLMVVLKSLKWPRYAQFISFSSYTQMQRRHAQCKQQQSV